MILLIYSCHSPLNPQVLERFHQRIMKVVRVRRTGVVSSADTDEVDKSEGDVKESNEEGLTLRTEKVVDAKVESCNEVVIEKSADVSKSKIEQKLLDYYTKLNHVKIPLQKKVAIDDAKNSMCETEKVNEKVEDSKIDSHCNGSFDEMKKTHPESNDGKRENSLANDDERGAIKRKTRRYPRKRRKKFQQIWPHTKVSRLWNI